MKAIRRCLSPKIVPSVRPFRGLIALTLLILVQVTTSAQPTVTKINTTNGTAAAIKVYNETIGSNARIYSGTQYPEYKINRVDTGHPYFLSDESEKGSIRYYGLNYFDVFMFYDLTRDHIIIENPYSGSMLEVIQDEVESFSMLGHDFARLTGDSTSKDELGPGFYDVLYSGTVKVYAKHMKEILNKIELGVEKKKFKQKTRYYIYKQGNYFAVKNKSSVWKVFRDKKNMMKNELSRNKIELADSQEAAIVQLAQLYDKIETRP